MKRKVLYILSSSHGLYFSKMRIYINDDAICDVPCSYFIKILSSFRLFVRLLRLEPRCIERLDANRFVLCIFHSFWILNINNKSLNKVFCNRKGWSDPLNLCKVGDSVFWGEYGDNSNRDKVNVYNINKSGRVKIVYSFANGQVRHIHNIIWDDINKFFYVLTGDTEKFSGIYKATEQWDEVIPVVVGSQQYRSVVAFSYKESLLYATDSVSTPNFIYKLESGVISKVAKLPGSCIYGCETRSFFIFSTTVEPPEGRSLFSLLSKKLGGGIEDNFSHVFFVNKSDLSVSELFSVKKDIFPMKLFQYGAVMFPKGQEHDDILSYYVMACKDDGTSNKLNIII